MVSSPDPPKMKSAEFLPVRVSALFDPQMDAMDPLPDCPLETTWPIDGVTGPLFRFPNTVGLELCASWDASIPQTGRFECHAEPVGV